MERNHDLEHRIFNATGFEELALEVYRFQYNSNAVYREYANMLHRSPEVVNQLDKIPFLPIELFKSNQIICGNGTPKPELVFRSSGTTSHERSTHYVHFEEVYRLSFTKAFQLIYGDPSEWRILALLPTYTERNDSSLVHMVKGLMDANTESESGFFLNNLDELLEQLRKPTEKKTLLIGVSFALLDLAEIFEGRLENTVVMETGGMKGRRKELTRQELHTTLMASFGVSHIHSEYGMTELLSQAYDTDGTGFRTPPWMQIYVREVNDPLQLEHTGRTGALNIADLANMYSCSFIATSDLGRKLSNGYTEVLGRIDYSDFRGCNLMAVN